MKEAEIKNWERVEIERSSSKARMLPVVNRFCKPLNRLDGKVLGHFQSLEYYATRRVVEMAE